MRYRTIKNLLIAHNALVGLSLLVVGMGVIVPLMGYIGNGLAHITIEIMHALLNLKNLSLPSSLEKEISGGFAFLGAVTGVALILYRADLVYKPFVFFNHSYEEEQLYSFFLPPVAPSKDVIKALLARSPYILALCAPLALLGGAVSNAPLIAGLPGAVVFALAGAIALFSPRLQALRWALLSGGCLILGALSGAYFGSPFVGASLTYLFAEIVMKDPSVRAGLTRLVFGKSLFDTFLPSLSSLKEEEKEAQGYYSDTSIFVPSFDTPTGMDPALFIEFKETKPLSRLWALSHSLGYTDVERVPKQDPAISGHDKIKHAHALALLKDPI